MANPPDYICPFDWPDVTPYDYEQWRYARAYTVLGETAKIHAKYGALPPHIVQMAQETAYYLNLIGRMPGKN